MQKPLLLSGLILATAPAFAQHGPSTSARSGLPPPAQRHAGPKTAKADLSPNVAVGGNVLLADGKPAASAQVYVSWVTQAGEIKFRRLATDAKGAFGLAFKLTPKPGSDAVAVAAVLPGRGIVWREASLKRKNLADLKLKLLSGTALTGRMLRSDGSPAAHIDVAVESFAPTFRGLQNGDAMQASLGNLRPEFMGQIASQFHGQTDANGRFTLTGLPPALQVTLRPGNGLRMASGSAGPIEIKAVERQDAGLLVAVKPGGIRLRIQDRATGKPATGVEAQLLPADTGLRFGIRNRMGNLDPLAAKSGEMEYADLLPGEYKLVVQGRVLAVHVDEGRTAPPIRIALRQGGLRGRLLDAHGKPLAGVGITVFNGTPHRLALQGPIAFPVQNNGVGEKTRADGSFDIDSLPWGSPNLTIRAIRGNDLAEWTGAPETLGASLVLKMQPNALVTVSGRLIDPQRRPLTKLAVQTLHWLDSPRSTWFATAHHAKCDAQGRFQVAGLERGEAFSLVTDDAASQAQGPGPQRARVVTEAMGAQVQAPVQAFESPRFTTVKAGQEQDLGEVMVHPTDGQNEINQIYGDEDPVQVARLSGFLPTQAPDEVAAARQALTQYLGALKAGDLGTLHQLTSRLSPGWSPDRRRFLEHCALNRSAASDPNSENVRALPLVPRTLAAFLLRSSVPDPSQLDEQSDALTNVDEPGGPMGGGNLSAVIRELDLNPNFLILAEKRAEGPGLAGVLCKEETGWRVLALPSELTATGGPFLSIVRSGPASLDQADFSRVPPALEEDLKTEARQAAEKFLSFWAKGRYASLQALTSPASPEFVADFDAFKARLAKRPDEGICPLTGDESAPLQPVENLTVWDQGMLMNLILRERFAAAPQQQVQQPQVQQQAAVGFTPEDPIALAKRGDTALFRYNAAGQSYLMVLLRSEGKWTVLEPAFAL